MLSRSVLAACSLAAALCLNSPAQSSSSQTPQNPAPTQTPPAQNQPATPPLQLHDLPPDPRTPTPAEAEQQHQQAQLNAAIRVASLQARWGPGMSTPGFSIALAEVRRSKTAEGNTQITYHVTGSGFSPDERLVLVRWPLNSDVETLMGGIGLDAKGTAVCADTAQPTPPADAAAGSAPQSTPSAPAPGAATTPPPANAPPSCATTMQPQQPLEIHTTAAQGEAVRVALLATDRKHGAAASIIPFPIVNADKGCQLQVILGTKNAALVLIEGSGFPPNTDLDLDTITSGATNTLHARSNAEGRTIVPVLVGVKPQTTGETTVRYAGANRAPSLQNSTTAATPAAACAPSVSFHWGEGAYKPQ